MSFMESNQDDLTSGQPNPDVSNPGGEQSSSEGASASEVTLQQLADQFKRLEGMVKTLQSGKDRGVVNAKKTAKAAMNRAEELTEQFETMQAYLKKYGSPEEASRQMAIDETILAGGLRAAKSEVSPETDLADQDQTTEADVDEELLNLMGVDPKDPAFVKLIQDGNEPLEAAKILARAKAGVVTQQQPTASSGVISTGGGGSANTPQAVLQAQYDKEVAQIRRGDVNALAALKKKYRDKGLAIW